MVGRIALIAVVIPLTGVGVFMRCWTEPDQVLRGVGPTLTYWPDVMPDYMVDYWSMFAHTPAKLACIMALVDLHLYAYTLAALSATAATTHAAVAGVTPMSVMCGA